MALGLLAACGGDEVRISVLAPNQVVAYDDGAATWNPVPIGDDGTAGFNVDGPYTVAAFCTTVSVPRVEVRQGDGTADAGWRFDCPAENRSSIGFDLVGSSQNVVIAVADQQSFGGSLQVPDGSFDVVALDWVDGKLLLQRDVNTAVEPFVVLDFNTPAPSVRLEPAAGWDTWTTVLTTRNGTRFEEHNMNLDTTVLAFDPSALRSGDRQVTTFRRFETDDPMRLEVDVTAGALGRAYRDWSGALRFADARVRTDGGWLELTFRETGDNDWDVRGFGFATATAYWHVEAHGGDLRSREVKVPDLRTHPGWRDAFVIDEPFGAIELRKFLDDRQTGVLGQYVAIEQL